MVDDIKRRKNSGVIVKVDYKKKNQWFSRLKLYVLYDG